MFIESTFVSAFLIGFFGSTHCIGMCGGIASALTFALPASQHSIGSLYGYHLIFSSGRIASYSLAGAIAAGLGGMLIYSFGSTGVIVLRSLAGGLMILMGLYVAGLSRLLTRVETAGAWVWRRISPLIGRLHPIDTPPKALLLGMLWGWLPCGLVYTALGFAATQGDWHQGALVMLGFGLGTLPSMTLVGVFARNLQRIAQHIWVRRSAGLLIIGFGIWTLYPVLAGHH